MDKAARPLDEKNLRGRFTEADATRPMGHMTHRNPGPTENLRGVEANTARSKGTPITVFPDTIPIEYGDPHEAPIPFDTASDDYEMEVG